MSNNREPMISVIIAIYNPGKYLKGCLDSVINQTYKNLEIILVDDGSTDNSLEVCKEYAEKDSRVIVHHKKNSGVSATRNAGIRLAHGDYFSFIDSDDILEPDAYEYMINRINEHNADIITYEHFITKPSKEIVHKVADEIYGLYSRRDGMRVLVHHFPFAWNKLFSKKTIEDVWFDETICRGEDGLFSRLAFDKADKVLFDKRPLYHYVQSEDSAVRGCFRRSQLTGVNLIDIYEDFFKNKYPELYDHSMSNILHLITTLYFDMRTDKVNYKAEQKEIVKRFRELYKKVDTTKISAKNKKLFRIFNASPEIFYLIKKVGMIKRGLKK